MWRLLWLSLCSYEVVGFATWMTKDFCHVRLEVGEVIMGDLAEESGDRTISLLRVHKNGTETKVDGLYYEPGEQLVARLDDPSGQFVIESSVKGVIEGGGCEGRRIATNEATLSMPIGNTTVSVKAGWALGHAQVMITRPVSLTPSHYVDPGPQLVVGGLRGVKSDETDSSITSVDTWVAPLSMILVALLLYVLGSWRGKRKSV